MAPVWLVVIAVEYVGLRLFFARDLSPVRRRRAPGHRGRRRCPPFPWSCVRLMLAASPRSRPSGVEPVWVARGRGPGAERSTRSARRRVAPVRAGTVDARLSFAVFVLCLGVVVAALAGTLPRGPRATLLPAGTGLASLLLLAAARHRAGEPGQQPAGDPAAGAAGRTARHRRCWPRWSGSTSARG